MADGNGYAGGTPREPAEPRRQPGRGSSWTDGLESGYGAYRVFRTDTKEELAIVYRNDLAFEFAKMLNEQFGIPAYWMPDFGTALGGDR